MAVQLYKAGSQVTASAYRTERKFYVTPSRIGLACGLLRHVCHVDKDFPSGQVNSLYFDTMDLAEHHASLSGDFRKDKVRIRWYGQDDEPGDRRTIFLELKSKEGFASTKQRRRLDVPAAQIARPYLARGIVSRTLLLDTLALFGYFPPAMLWPVIKISYERYRFTDPLTGQRVSLDCRIRSTMVMPGTGYGEQEIELSGGVIEIKGANMALPETLRQLGVLGVDWSRFSKYSACLDSHGEGLGTVGRLSPSGRVVWL